LKNKMNVTVLAFGVAKDIFGGSSVEAELKDAATTDDLKSELEGRFPKLKALSSYMVAINNEYANGDEAIKVTDEIAIIPPVSGG
jgi:molybdopterin synthase sulfur carrier subunit